MHAKAYSYIALCIHCMLIIFLHNFSINLDYALSNLDKFASVKLIIKENKQKCTQELLKGICLMFLSVTTFISESIIKSH